MKPKTRSLQSIPDSSAKELGKIEKKMKEASDKFLKNKDMTSMQEIVCVNHNIEVKLKDILTLFSVNLGKLSI